MLPDSVTSPFAAFIRSAPVPLRLPVKVVRLEFVTARVPVSVPSPLKVIDFVPLILPPLLSTV